MKANKKKKIWLASLTIKKDFISINYAEIRKKFKLNC
jgi:hypothetical protein